MQNFFTRGIEALLLDHLVFLSATHFREGFGRFFWEKVVFYLVQNLRHAPIFFKKHADAEVQHKSVEHDPKISDNPVIMILPP